MKGSGEFELAVTKIFQHWDVLHHAVSSNFGGIHSEEKADWLPGVVVEFFIRNRDLEPPEVETFVSEIMDNEFDLLVEDGSLKRLSRQLCRCYVLARDERFGELNEFLDVLPPLPTTPVRKVQNEDESDEESGQGESMEIDDIGRTETISKPKNEPIVDEDGFTLVVGKKKH